MSIPHILVLGATGVSGLIFLSEVAKLSTPPAKLTVLVRSRAKLSAGLDESIRVIEGGLDDEAKVAEALEGVDTVVSFLGAYVSLSAFIFRTTTTPIADGLKVVTRVMKAKGIKRILVLSTPSFAIPGETLTTLQWIVGFLPPFMVPQGNAEMKAIATTVTSDDALDWTVFRVPHLSLGTGEEKVWAGLFGPEYKGGLDLTRESLARWVLREIAGLRPVMH